MDELIKKTITVKNIENVSNRFIVTDENGNKYSAFLTKKDGSESQASKDLSSIVEGETITAAIKQSGQYQNIVAATVVMAGGGQHTKEDPIDVIVKKLSQIQKITGEINEMLTKI